MDIGISSINRVFKTYQGQVRIAELNSKNPVKRAQGQRDLVSISSEAKTALTKHAMEHLLKQLRSSQAAKAEEVPSEEVPSENLEVETIQTDKVETEKHKTIVSAELSE
jgi:hypothetical protein